jgi:hypothetical protein
MVPLPVKQPMEFLRKCKIGVKEVEGLLCQIVGRVPTLASI